MTRPLPTIVMHLTRVDRLPEIMDDGLLPDREARRRGLGGVELGYAHIKDRRARRPVPCGAGGSVGDYVPFYFAPRSPMLYAISKGRLGDDAADMDAIVYLVSTTQRLRASGLTVVTTDRNAALAVAAFRDDDTALDSDDFVDWPLMRERMWASTADDPDRNERRQAECLAHPNVPWHAIEELVVRSPPAGTLVQTLLTGRRHHPPVRVRPDWYF